MLLLYVVAPQIFETEDKQMTVSVTAYNVEDKGGDSKRPRISETKASEPP